MARPLVSVVLPTHDRPNLLRRAVETVVAQTYDRVELVVVDDHSERPAREVVDEVDTSALESVVVERHEESRGGNAARDTAIRHAAGDLLAFLDDDDEWEPTKLEKQVDVFEAGGERVGVVYTGERYIYDDGERVITDTVRGDVTRAILCGASLATFSTLMVRRDVVAKAGLPDARVRSWQDREWLLRLSLHCEFDVVPEPLTIRHWDHRDRVGDRFVERRDESFPLMVERYRDLAREYGVEREFVASLLETLTMDAAQNGFYADARRLALRSIRLQPTRLTSWLYFAACLAGPLTYRPAKALARGMLYE